MRLARGVVGMRVLWCCGVAVALLAPVWAGAQIHGDSFYPFQVEDDSVAKVRTLRNGGGPLLEYRYGNVTHKPYIQKLFTPGDVNILLDSPPDHVHHHALMLALEVDGVDYWGETAKCGRQLHRSFSQEDELTSRGGVVGGWQSRTLWLEPKTDAVALVEERRILADRRIARREDVSLMTWQSDLSAGVGRPSVKLGGRHYFGLGLRMIHKLDGGRFFNASGKPGKVVRGDERNVKANWCAYTAILDGKPVTVAMFGHPDNPRGAPLWFTMSRPFAYLSAGLNLHEEPLVLPRGETLKLCYGVAVWDGGIDYTEVEKLYRAWLNAYPSAEKKKEAANAEAKK